ncbi:AraC-like DNA-binding protein [Curtobacterium sp. PhB130]|uniref:AraC family transcriptional regulator n=1 Tax=Curtobacterium sp. PhB130 TaxID=2485178 RepID=UPI000F4CE816|nr:helix-turn-helix transcriptional regulator [Curtobacterium sp. PhB130]ROS78088.1 AraC-like DNA-binding protein [Curtobacterium sp. PhB130]
MRNVRVEEHDHLSRDVLPIGTEYPPDFLLARHAHRRAQVLYGASGVMLVETDEGSWTVPTDRAVLIPPGVEHEVRMLDVTTWSLYVEPDAVPWWPTSCTVVEVGPLLRELLRAAFDLPLEYDPHGRDGAVLRLALQELQRVAPLPLTVALPTAGALRDLCRAYLADPDVHVTNADWARSAAVSERTLDRRFRAALGVGPAAWRTRARLLASLPALRDATVTEVASGLGYASPAAFTAAFTKAFGSPPSRFRRAAQA